MITTVVRTIILYIFITLGIRIMGKRQIGDMQPNELVITLLISEIAAIPLQDTAKPVLDGITAIFMLIILEIIMSVLCIKSILVRKLMNGKSVVLIKNGTIDQTAMKRVRMTVLDLIEMLRVQNIFDISTISYAVLEVNGDLSVLLKKEEQNPSLKDLGIKAKKEGLPLPVITNGKIISESLDALEITEKDLQSKLKANRTDVKSVFLMTLDRYGNINIVKTRDGV